ncbi:pth11-like integral membrane protein [Colletotrichum plurivorum]|uniref:Pth11-like integral membrane protein n=1 Tax=Colletotrichum plurivorum TaxID=2175906 RepID=A0A8H6JKR8_9PEZI|nr:pth11-like integral membrane protein [Colletotrichum plurivorum]
MESPLSDVDDLTLSAAEESTANPNETRAPLVVGVTTTALFLATLVTVLRVYVRGFLMRKWGADDTALVASYVLVFVTGLLMLISRASWDSLYLDILKSVADFFLQIAITAVAVYQAVSPREKQRQAYPLIKCTFLLQYRRVFPLPPFQRLCDIFLAFIVAFGITQVISLTLACIPLRSLWDFTVPGKCFDLLSWWYVGSSINLLTDLAILCMPVPLLRTVRLPIRQKIVLMSTFGLGLFTCAISVVRLTTLKKSSTSTDPTYETVVAGIWSITEVSCAIVCVCVPTLRPLLGAPSPSLMTHNYLPHNIEESADTELSTQTDSSRKRRSRTAGKQSIGDPENPRIVIHSRTASEATVTTPARAHTKESRDELRRQMAAAMTLPLTRIDTDDGVEFLPEAGPEREAELPTPLQPPPRRHTDRMSVGDYFGAMAWESSRQSSLVDSTEVRESSSTKDKGDDPP